MMRLKKYFLTGCGLFFMLLLHQHTVAQQVIQCATMEQDSINRARFPQRGELNDFEIQLQNKIKEINARSRSGRTQATVITIPIVVHVVHNGEAVGTGANISQAQVKSQLEVLNEDFRKKAGTPGFNTNPVGADIEIEFCLSPVNENGVTLAEPGIDRVRGANQIWTRAQIDGSLKPSTIWNPNLFFNVWTLKFGGEDANLLGYAQFPDQSNLTGLNTIGGPATTDGVVIQYTSFGSADKGTFPVMSAPYNKGRTLSHETGHFFGLRHIWGDGSCASDFVDDTPTQQNESRGCPTNKLSCDGSTPAMVQNYMDYSDDACMNIFTNGQKARILAVLELSPRRKTLGKDNLCSGVADSKPVARFSIENQKCILLGSEISFTDLSSNFPTSWKWSFPGGDPSTSTLQNPKVKYTTAASYDVTLTATNAKGDSTITIKNYIVVSDQGLCNTFSNFNATYTPSVLKLSSFGNYKGYLAGHNSAQSKAFSEFFTNDCGYTYISGVNIQFGKLYTLREDATINVVVWNARGPQNSPAAVIERKAVLYKQIKSDLAANKPTSIVFDRETPVFGKPFQVGIEISYDNGDSLAIQSSANGEATNATSWIQNASGTWTTYAIAFGANIALNIQPLAGMNPSVQMSASKTLIAPGEEVTFNGKGASIFSWNALDGSVQNAIGPQLVVRPDKTTTYEVTGSGLELCQKTARTTIFTREGTVTGLEPAPVIRELQLYPNPGSSELHLQLSNKFIGTIGVQIHSAIGHEVGKEELSKTTESFSAVINTTSLAQGIYFITVSAGTEKTVRKWIKIR
jgi:PKD repeat protein